MNYLISSLLIISSFSCLLLSLLMSKEKIPIISIPLLSKETGTMIFIVLVTISKLFISNIRTSIIGMITTPFLTTSLRKRIFPAMKHLKVPISQQSKANPQTVSASCLNWVSRTIKYRGYHLEENVPAPLLQHPLHEGTCYRTMPIQASNSYHRFKHYKQNTA